MSKYIRTIGDVYVNYICFDIYENKDGSATIRPCKAGSDFPRKKWICFESLEALEANLELNNEHDLSGAALVHYLKTESFSFVFD